MAEFSYTDLLPLGHDETTYKKIAEGGVDATQAFGRSFISVDPQALTLLSRTAFRDIAHLLRPAHLRQLRSILDDPGASPNDRYVARDLLQNANIAAGASCRCARTPGRRS
jgi:fumarate hydratase class I